MSAAQAESVYMALRVVGDPVTLPPRRHEATLFLETCRKDRGTVLIMKSLLESPQINSDSTMCFLCLSLVDLCRAALPSMPIRTKLAKLISELGKRQYPQLWDSFVADLLGSWSVPHFSLKAQVCAMGLEFLVEDCVDSNFNEGLPAKRRNDILVELKSKDLSPILDLSYGILSQYYGHIATLPSGAGPELTEAIAAMNTVLGMLAPLALLAKPSEMTDPLRNYADVTVLLLNVEPLKDRALELLGRVGRVGHLLSREALGSLLQSLPPVLGKIFGSLPGHSIMDGHLYYGSSAGRVVVDGLDKFDYSKRLIEVATVILASNLELLEDRHDSDSVDRQQVYIEVLATATIYVSSRRLYLDVIKHWHKLLKVTFLQKLSFMSGVIMRMLMIFVSSCSKVPWALDEDIPVVSPYSKDEILLAEFESGDEFMANYGIYRATVCDLVREAARCFPLVAAMFAKSYLSFVIERLGMHPIVAVQSEAYVEIDSFVLFLEGICTVVMSSIRSSDLGAGHMSPEVVALADSAQLVLAWQPVAPLLVLNKLRFLSGIPGVLNLSAPFTSSCFEYLFSLLSYECTDVKDTAVEDQVMQVRRRATATISSLCSTVPILSKDPVLMEKVYTSAVAFLQNSAVLHSQKTNMIETLVGLADKLPSETARRGMMVSIMHDTVATITSRDVGAVICSSSDLLTYLTLCMSDIDKLSLLIDFKQSVNSFVGACRKVSAPALPESMWVDELLGAHCMSYNQLLEATAFGILWRDVLPVLCTALNSLLGVYTPAIRAHIEAISVGGASHPLTSLFVMSPFDITDLTKAKVKPPTAVTNHVVEKVASLFKETALSVYHAIGLSIWHKVLYLNEACHKSVTQSLVAHVECMENRQMRTILKYIVQRYVLNLPRPGFSIGYPFVVTFFKAVGKRMDWMNPILPSSINHHAHEIEYQTVERAGNVKSCFLSESLFDMYIYRKAGISSHFHQKAQFTCEQIEEVRNAIITDLNRKLVDTFAALFSVSDILSIQHNIAEKEKSKMGTSPQHGRVKTAQFEDAVDEDLSLPSGDKAIAIRRASVNNFVFGPGRDELAALLLDLTLKGLQIPDQILMAKSIRIFQYLCTEQTSEKHANDSHVHGWADERIAIYMGTTVFGTCLGTLVRDERLLALDYVILMEDILSRFEPLRSRINSTNPDISSAPFSDEEVMSMPPCAVIAKFSGCSVGLVLGLCTTISTLKAKKARRDALRDLVTDIMMHAKGKSDQKLNLIMNLPFPSRADISTKPVSLGLLDQVAGTGAQPVLGCWGTDTFGIAHHDGAAAGLTELFTESS